jgi:hypothetical protein
MTTTSEKSKKFTRTYSDKTLKLLFGLSGNRCAHPDCPSKLIADSTPHDDSIIVGHIAHIYSGTAKGPRPCPFESVSEEFINGYDNLLLLCRNHHALVDGQESSFSVETLKQWKLDHSYRVLATRASVLPERFHQFAWMGARFTVQTMDGTIASISVPVSRVVREQGFLGDRNVVYVDRQVWIRLDNGYEFDLKLQNLDPPAREGARVTLLLILDAAGNVLPYSLFNHASATWTRLNRVWRNFEWSISTTEWGLGGLLFLTLLGAVVNPPLLLGLPMHDNALLSVECFVAASLIGAALRHWRLWQHALTAMRETQFV